MICLIVSRYQYKWKLEEAQKNILRAHTTAVSARMLYKLGQQVDNTQCHSACVVQNWMMLSIEKLRNK